MKIFDPTKYRVRKLTPMEYGRLQAFPMDDWEQVVSDSQAYKQFGNAVTVNVVQAIAEKIKECLPNPEAETITRRQEVAQRFRINNLSGKMNEEDRQELCLRLVRAGYCCKIGKEKKPGSSAIRYYVEYWEDEKEA